MSVSRVILCSVLLVGFLVLGCVQSGSAGSLSSGSSAASKLASVSPVSSAVPSATAVIRVSPRASAQVATVLPSIQAALPSLADFAAAFNHASNLAFNDSRVAYKSSPDVWVIDHTTKDYQYTIFIRPSITRNWSSLDVVGEVLGASGLAKNVSLTQGQTGPYYQYHVVLKCFSWHYEVELNLLDYVTLGGSSEYRRSLGPAVMLTLADACPN